jgi:hypothetical protein
VRRGRGTRGGGGGGGDKGHDALGAAVEGEERVEGEVERRGGAGGQGRSDPVGRLLLRLEVRRGRDAHGEVRPGAHSLVLDVQRRPRLVGLVRVSKPDLNAPPERGSQDRD